MQDEDDKLADEADRYADQLADMGTVDLTLLRYGLQHDYDVIVSEALDWVMHFGLVDDLADEILAAAKRNQSFLVSARLILCTALTTDANFKAALRPFLYNTDDAYRKAWESAALYIETGRKEHIQALENLANSPDRTIASLSASLLEFISAHHQQQQPGHSS